MKNISLADKYRPKTLPEIIGQSAIVASLMTFAISPAPQAFIFDGQSGTGKTSAAYALARAIGCEVDMKEWGGLHEIASGELTAENVREMFNTTLRYHPWHGSGWKVLICNEADNMSDKASYVLLDVLEKLPAKCIVIFTTNSIAKLSRRFRDRCEILRFGAEVNNAVEIEAQNLINRVWLLETGRTDAPRLASLNAIEEGQISYRAILRAIEPLARAAAPVAIAPIIAGDKSPATARGPIRVELPVKKAPMRIHLKPRESALSAFTAAGEWFKTQTAGNLATA